MKNDWNEYHVSSNYYVGNFKYKKDALKKAQELRRRGDKGVAVKRKLRKDSFKGAFQ